MKRFLVFAGDNYYPSGGWEDYMGQANSKEEAVALAKSRSVSPYTSSGYWWHVVDTLEGKICAQS